MIPNGARSLTGRFWRMKFVTDAEDVLAPAGMPEGRSHYEGQKALYLSETPEGCVIASRRYFKPDDPPRALFPLRVVDAVVVDLRDKEAVAALGIDTTHRAATWQDWRARGERPPTWDLSDRVRKLGLDGMLYASRSDPSKTHLTLFRWNDGRAKVDRDGDPKEWNGAL